MDILDDTDNPQNTRIARTTDLYFMPILLAVPGILFFARATVELGLRFLDMIFEPASLCLTIYIPSFDNARLHPNEMPDVHRKAASISFLAVNLYDGQTTLDLLDPGERSQ